MGVLSFFKKIFSAEDKEEEELDKARARHGIVLSEKDKIDMKKMVTEEEKFTQDFDAWEELKKMRMNFFFGSWATRKFRVVGEDKVKQELEELEKKREEKAKKQEWDRWEREKEKKGEK